MTDDLTPAERELLAYLPADGSWLQRSRPEMTADTGRSPSYVNRALRSLAARGLIDREASAGGSPSRYRLASMTTRPQPGPEPGPEPGLDPTRSDPVSPVPLAGARTSPPPTPSTAVSGSLVSDPVAPARENPTRPDPTRSDPVVPIGRLAVAAMMEAAAAAGKAKPDSELRGRVGQTAQRLATAGETIERILAGARRVGEGAGRDLETAVGSAAEGKLLPIRATRPSPTDFSELEAAADASRSARLADAAKAGDAWDGFARHKPDEMVEVFWELARRWEKLVPLAVRSTWHEELAVFPMGCLRQALRNIGREGEPFPPTVGRVYREAASIYNAAVERHRADLRAADLRRRLEAE